MAMSVLGIAGIGVVFVIVVVIGLVLALSNR